MAASGIQTLFIQSSHNRSAADVIEPERLAALHRPGPWPRACGSSPGTCRRSENVDRRSAPAPGRRRVLPVDGIGVDIESRAVADHAERNRRLLDLPRRLNHMMGDRAVAAITPVGGPPRGGEPVVLAELPVDAN